MCTLSLVSGLGIWSYEFFKFPIDVNHSLQLDTAPVIFIPLSWAIVLSQLIVSLNSNSTKISINRNWLSARACVCVHVCEIDENVKKDNVCAQVMRVCTVHIQLNVIARMTTKAVSRHDKIGGTSNEGKKTICLWFFFLSLFERYQLLLLFISVPSSKYVNATRFMCTVQSCIEAFQAPDTSRVLLSTKWNDKWWRQNFGAAQR